MQELIGQAGVVGYILMGVIVFATAVILYKVYYFHYVWPIRESELVRSVISGLQPLASQLLRKDEIFMWMETEMSQEKRKLQKYLSSLATVSSVAPLLGLLGTITGMIRSTGGILNVDNNMLLRGISEALITTAIGIIIAIPSIIAYNFFVGRVENILEETKEKVFQKLKK